LIDKKNESTDNIQFFTKNSFKHKNNSTEILHKDSANSNNNKTLENSWIEEFDQNVNINNTVNLINNSLKYLESSSMDKKLLDK